MGFWKKEANFSKDYKRQIILDKYKSKCAYCGCKITLKEMTVDHIIPRDGFFNRVSVGDMPFYLKNLTVDDVNHLDNLNPSCHPCNVFKSNLSLDGFRNKVLSSKITFLNFRLKRRIRKNKGYLFYFELVLLKKKM